MDHAEVISRCTGFAGFLQGCRVCRQPHSDNKCAIHLNGKNLLECKIDRTINGWRLYFQLPNFPDHRLEDHHIFWWEVLCVENLTNAREIVELSEQKIDNIFTQQSYEENIFTLLKQVGDSNVTISSLECPSNAQAALIRCRLMDENCDPENSMPLASGVWKVLFRSAAATLQ